MKKRHHYIPVFYLDGFVDPHNKPYLWIYEKGNPDIRRASSKDVAVQKNYFSQTYEDEKESDTLENALAKVEGITSSVLKKIKERKLLNDEDKAKFAYFLALMMTRVPNFRNNVGRAMGQLAKKLYMELAANQNAFEDSIRRFEEHTGKKIGMPIEEIRKFAFNGEYDVALDSQYSLAKGISVCGRLALILVSMKWLFLRATDDYKFLTGDNPVFYCDPTHDPNSPYGVGLANENIELTFPLSRDLALFARWRGKDLEYRPGKNNTVKAINRRTVLAALRFVFSSQKSDSVNRLVQNYVNSAPVLKVT